LLFFGIWYFVVAPVGGILRKLNDDAHVQTFPYPTVSKSFLYSNAFMAKLCAQSMSFYVMNLKLNAYGHPSGNGI